MYIIILFVLSIFILSNKVFFHLIPTNFSKNKLCSRFVCIVITVGRTCSGQGSSLTCDLSEQCHIMVSEGQVCSTHTDCDSSKFGESARNIRLLGNRGRCNSLEAHCQRSQTVHGFKVISYNLKCTTHSIKEKNA